MSGRDLGLRIAVALVGAPLLTVSIFLGGGWFFAVVAVIALRGQWELNRLLAPGRDALAVRVLGMAVGIALLTDAWLFAGSHWGLVLVAGTAAVLLDLVIHPEMMRPGTAAGSVTLSWVYVAAPLAHLFWLRGGEGILGTPPGGPWVVLGLFLMVWGTDTLAYFAGMRWGRHKLVPAVSPGKSVEGLAAGVAGAGTVGALLALWVPDLAWSLPAGAGLGLLMGAAAVLGDLMESRLKRGAGAKDAGALLPGHGGVLDRFDSTLLCAPLLYYVLVLLAAV
ncbi:MAG: phosphatidate cytidylyltransferase [bacterium]